MVVSSLGPAYTQASRAITAILFSLPSTGMNSGASGGSTSALPLAAGEGAAPPAPSSSSSPPEEAGAAEFTAIAEAVPEALVGAGTLRTPADPGLARDAGAEFAVSPGYTSELAAACAAVGLPLLPGVATASDVMRAYADGFRFCKFFPAVAAGGTPLLKALSGPFADVQFCPTGGVTPANAPEFLALANVEVCGGTWLTPADLVAAQDWDAITELARRATALA